MEPETTSMRAKAVWAGTGGARAKRNRVLIVEDEEQSRSALQAILEEEGYEVAVAEDGEGVVPLAQQFQPDVVVLDLVLPKLDGFAVARRMKRHAETARIPLLAVTASWLGADGERLQKVGFDAALRKPVEAVAFLDELMRLLPAA